ncbi:glycogen phosphorylase 1-like [Hibiscus syriacus]|uniref:glycogen phosphorylase 1-like n=1 Tax=Hibiscus syriacus TaxID=106335 RepID=UPI0019218583|nr:glycogen phosphorylase 1-like [Hibiscus syriacus]
MGRSLSNSVINLGIRDQFEDALSQFGFEFEVLAEQVNLTFDFLEGHACLGNGGLARLSACQMDSLATLDYPAIGCGLRYQYGLFRQVILDGFQHEQPDYWLNFGNPWEIERVHITYCVKFYGTVTDEVLNKDKIKVWIPGEMVEAVEYDNPIPGYGTRNTIVLRLWAAKPSDQHNMISLFPYRRISFWRDLLLMSESYNTGDYVDAVVNRQRAEVLVAYYTPMIVLIRATFILFCGGFFQGKELRLKQQYFFVSASVQDIIRRFKDAHRNFDQLPEKVALQLNDTHPSLAIAEVMRVLLDEEHLGWKRAWDIICKIFSFTTHSISPEALEKIPVDLLGSLLPRHLQIIYDINFQFVEELKKMIGLDYDRLARMSIVEEGAVKNIRMANLSIICSHTVNGVSRFHSELLRTKLFKDFYELWPYKFHYKTNGVTQRRWIVVSNPSLCVLISKWLGTEAWIRDIDLLIGLRDRATDAELHQEWKMVKKVNKIRVTEYIEAMSVLKVVKKAIVCP